MSGELGYFTIPVADAERGRVFYGGLFGWQFEAQGAGFHITNTTPPGGLHAGGEGSRPRVWFRVDDIKTAVEQVRKLGGHADEPLLSPSGWSSVCRDDQGTHFDLWEPAEGYR